MTISYQATNLFQKVLLRFFVDPIELFKHHDFARIAVRYFVHLSEEAFPQKFAFDQIGSSENSLALRLDSERTGSR